jgi:hypothetical protein
VYSGVITKADKGNTLVIIHKNEYCQKIDDFIAQNNFTKIESNYTKKQQNAIKATINQCNITIKEIEKWRYININPETPHIHGTIKLHKDDKPIRPIVYWKNIPGYKLTALLAGQLKNSIQLPNVYNIQNSENLINNLKEMKIQNNTKLCSFDIKNMYTNIPQNDLTNIINNTLINNNILDDQKNEIMKLVKVILNQNNFQHNNQTYIQREGLAMDAPTSAIPAEIFIQNLEHNDILKILQKHQILDYYRYVDDILIIYNEDCTDINNTLTDFNSIHPNIQYTIETQNDNKINYLDITIENKNNTLTFDIYRKPTTTDIIIRNDSCHPTEHKHSAIRCMINRMNTYPISTENKHKETQLISTILHNNGYSPQTFIQNKNLQKR